MIHLPGVRNRQVCMFGIGFGEFVIIALVLIVAVGPEKLPALMKTVGRTLRQVKKTSEDLRRSTGIDELMRENLWEESRPASPPRNLPASAPEGTRAAQGRSSAYATETAKTQRADAAPGPQARDAETSQVEGAPRPTGDPGTADPEAAEKEGRH